MSQTHGKKSSTARKLVQAAALAAVLVPLGTVAVDAASITCGFGSASVGSGCSTSGAARIFDFGPYDLKLKFDSSVSASITVEDLLTTQGLLTGGPNRLSAFPDHTCVQIVAGNCVEFRVIAQSGLGFYNMFIHWDLNTNSAFSNEPGNRIRLLHAVGDDTYDVDITVLGTYDDDPGIGGRDNNFQRFLPTQGPPIPEPATVLLIGSGLGLLYYRRRRRTEAGGKPNA